QGLERRGAGAGPVGADPAGAAVGLADHVVPLGSQGSVRIGPRGGRVLRHDRVAEGRRPTFVVHAASGPSEVAADGAVGQRGPATGGELVQAQAAAVVFA